MLRCLGDRSQYLGLGAFDAGLGHLTNGGEWNRAIGSAQHSWRCREPLADALPPDTQPSPPSGSATARTGPTAHTPRMADQNRTGPALSTPACAESRFDGSRVPPDLSAARSSAGHDGSTATTRGTPGTSPASSITTPRIRRAYSTTSRRGKRHRASRSPSTCSIPGSTCPTCPTRSSSNCSTRGSSSSSSGTADGWWRSPCCSKKRARFLRRGGVAYAAKG